MIPEGAHFLGEYLEAVPQPLNGRKTKAWAIYSRRRGDLLANVRWYGRWRQFVVYPEPGTLFNAECLRQLAQLCAGAYADWYEAKKMRR